MSVFGKLAFWKKGDDFSSPGSDPFTSGAGDPFAQQSSAPMGQSDPYAQQPTGPDPFGGDQIGGQGDPMGQPPMGNLPDASRFKGAEVPQGSQQGFSDVSSFTQDKQRPGYSTFAPQQQAAAPTDNHDLEMINTKLDTIRAYLDSINQRLTNIEKMAQEGTQESTQYKW